MCGKRKKTVCTLSSVLELSLDLEFGAPASPPLGLCIMGVSRTEAIQRSGTIGVIPLGASVFRLSSSLV